MSSMPLPRSSEQPVYSGVAEGATSRLSSLATLYVLTLRQHLHGKRWMVMAGLFLMIVGLVVIVRATSPDVPARQTEFLFAFLFIPQTMLPLLALVYASGIVWDEQEEQTMTYLLIRPIPKWALYTVKLAATVTTTVCMAACLTALTYVAVYAGAGWAKHDASTRCLEAVGLHSLAVIVYCCLFGLLSLLTNRALVLGILVMLCEGVVANLPLSVRMATVVYYIRLIAYRTMNFVVETPWYGSRRRSDLAAEYWQFDVARDPGLLEHPTTRTCLIVLFGASLAFAVIAAIVFSVREFYVKTPEKS